MKQEKRIFDDSMLRKGSPEFVLWAILLLLATFGLSALAWWLSVKFPL